MGKKKNSLKNSLDYFYVLVFFYPSVKKIEKSMFFLTTLRDHTDCDSKSRSSKLIEGSSAGFSNVLIDLKND